MKSIVYIFIFVIISGIIINAFPQKNPETNTTVTIQCIDQDQSAKLLEESADIIKSRLADFGYKKVDYTIDPASCMISFNLKGQYDVNEAISLFTAKGKIGFYETYNRTDIIETHEIGEELTTLLNVSAINTGTDEYSGILGYCNAAHKSDVEEYLENRYVSKPGHGINFMWSNHPNQEGYYNLYLLKAKSLLDNSNVMESVVKMNKLQDQAAILITLDKAGTALWSDITKRNIGKWVAIVLDKEVLSSPMVMAEIKGGKSMITGDFEMKEINLINAFVNNDPLPLTFVVKE